jgi:DNA-binding response OmpR family regulator
MTTKILVVDDEPAIGKLLTYQLQGYGYRVSYVADGLYALEQLVRENPDLVLLDVMMPTISGWEVCQQIRASSAVPIIMLTAKSSDADIVTGLNAGADDYISKPFSMAQVHARIEAVLRRTRAPVRQRAIGEEVPRHISQPKVAPAVQPVIATPIVTPQPVEVPQPVPHIRIGPRLREARLERGTTLSQAARDCGTRWEFLQAIEQENFSYVPRPQLRATLQSYSSYLGVDLRDWMSKPQLPSPPPQRKTSLVLQYATILTLVLLVLAVGIYFM